MTRPPNILVFVSHDTGRCLSPYGYATFRTPHCQRLAAEGVRLSRAFSTCPLCSPARAALFTGRYPHQNGVDGLVGPSRGFRLYDDERHAARLFAEAGYESVLCGMVHETDDCTTLGFDRFLCGAGTSHNDGHDLLTFGEHIGDWLQQRDQQQPFYLQIGCSDTHREWRKRAEPDREAGCWQPPWLLDLPEVHNEVAEFQGAVRRLDEGIGRILAAVDTANVAENTICVFTTDHGEDFPLAKGTCRDPGIGVFCLMRYPPGDWGRGRVVDELISHVDVLPTLLEACGIAVPGRITGRSFLPLLRGESTYRPRDAIFAGKTFHELYDPRRAIRTERWKYIRHFALNPYRDLRKATIERQHHIAYNALRLHHEDLYDLQADPNERHNLAQNPETLPVLHNLRQRLADWMRDTDDPLLRGPVTTPVDAAHLRELVALTQERRD